MSIDIDPTRINPMPDGSTALIPGVGWLSPIHAPGHCWLAERCCVHSPSSHHMRTWPMGWSEAERVLLRYCPHGAIHPDPDDWAGRAAVGKRLHHDDCDGCCWPPVFSEGFTPGDIECRGCRGYCDQMIRDEGLAALVEVVLAYEAPHLVLRESGEYACGADWRTP